MTPDQGTTPERLKRVPVSWVFDVDGPVTDPVEKRVTNPEFFDQCIALLAKGSVIAFNTGRSIQFITSRVIDELKTHIHAQQKPLSLIGNVFAVGEKGAVWMEFDETGVSHEFQDETISVPVSLQQKARRLVEEKFRDSMFFDETKQTMISVEMHDGYGLAAFHSRQTELNKELETLLQEEKHEDLELDPSTIATDIQNRHVGKDLGARRIMDWLQRQGIKPELFVTFGDSKSDAAMAREFEKQHPTIFVFVGKKNEEVKAQNVRRTDKLYSEGTLEFLRNPDLPIRA